MATLTCPSCHQDSFTWHIDDEVSEITIWGCNLCSYRAKEDESTETECDDCGQKSKSKLTDNIREYWWCSSCNSTKIIHSEEPL